LRTVTVLQAALTVTPGITLKHSYMKWDAARGVITLNPTQLS
jgi:hypothetical protein